MYDYFDTSSAKRHLKGLLLCCMCLYRIGCLLQPGTICGWWCWTMRTHHVYWPLTTLTHRSVMSRLLMTSHQITDHLVSKLSQLAHAT